MTIRFAKEPLRRQAGIGAAEVAVRGERLRIEIDFETAARRAAKGTDQENNQRRRDRRRRATLALSPLSP